MRKYKLWLVLAALLLLVFNTGCDSVKKTMDPAAGSSSSQQNGGSSNAGNPDKKAPAQGETIQVYFPNVDGSKLVAVNRKIKGGEAKYKEAVQALIDGPEDKQLTAVMPKNTKVQSVKVEKGTAYVDFSREFVKNFTGGSTGELMLVGSLVNTLTENAEIKAVQILVEGKKIDMLAGHMDLSEPVKRMKDLLKN